MKYFTSKIKQTLHNPILKIEWGYVMFEALRLNNLLLYFPLYSVMLNLVNNPKFEVNNLTC